MELKGIIVEIFNTVEVTASFKKREFVIKYADNPTYPEYPKFEMIQDKCTVLDKYSEGQEVAVSFNLKGRKWVNPQGENQYFNALQAWKIEQLNSQSDSGENELHTSEDPNDMGLPF